MNPSKTLSLTFIFSWMTSRSHNPCSWSAIRASMPSCRWRICRSNSACSSWHLKKIEAKQNSQVWVSEMASICLFALLCILIMSLRSLIHWHKRTYAHISPPPPPRTHAHTNTRIHMHACTHTHKHTYTQTTWSVFLLFNKATLHYSCVHNNLCNNVFNWKKNGCTHFDNRLAGFSRVFPLLSRVLIGLKIRFHGDDPLHHRTGSFAGPGHVFGVEVRSGKVDLEVVDDFPGKVFLVEKHQAFEEALRVQQLLAFLPAGNKSEKKAKSKIGRTLQHNFRLVQKRQNIASESHLRSHGQTATHLL